MPYERNEKPRTARRIGICWVAATLVLSACVTTGTTSSYPPGSPQAQLAERNAQYNNLLLQGCGAGLLLGAIGGLLIGGNAKSTAIGAGTGVAVGCLAGAGIAEQNLSRQEKEDVLDDRIAAAEASVRDYQAEVGITKQIVTEEKEKIADLRRRLARKQASKTEVTQQLAQVDESISIVNSNISIGQKRIEGLNKEIAELEDAGLKTAEIKEQERKMRILQQEQQKALGSLLEERGSIG